MTPPETLTTAATADFNLAGLELIGPIARLQVQISPLKQGEKPHRWYDPSPIASVPSLRIESGGVVGLDGDERRGDVHHRDHPLSRYRGENGISIGFTSHYAIMRAHFGDHLTDGIAGENLLIETDRRLTGADLKGGVLVVSDRGVVAIDDIQVAPPCVEFGKFSLRYGAERTADREVAAAVKFLHEGVRGFYATCQLDEDAIAALPPIAVGNLVYRRV
ncbi:MAG TPA: hypothetical protein VFQ54_00015 [Thermomicrobiales bacterium]|nr:hypothetical protein [Thermomicrobiales bacterium]